MLSNDSSGHQTTLLSIVFFALVALFFHWFARRQKFFTLPTEEWKGPYWSLIQLISIFIVYIISALFVPKLVGNLLHMTGTTIVKAEKVALFQLVSTVATMVILFFFCLIWPRREALAMWKSRQGRSFWGDVGYGVLYWAISLPVVFAVNHLCEWINEVAFGVTGSEQVAVKFLKASLASPFYFAIALLAIVIGAPFIEEFIFRCCLQGYLRKLIGSKAAILITALTFALFHYSAMQGYGNLPILTSLFALAIYLGWVFEKRQSLWASISLHMTFNTANVGYILTTMEKTI